MFDQSITGIRTNLDAFAQSAARLDRAYSTNMPPEGSSEQTSRGNQAGATAAEKNRTNPQSAEQAARAQNAYRSSGAAPTKSAQYSRESNPAVNENTASGEDAAKSGWANKAEPVDEAAETAKMMVAKAGVEANVAALKTAMALSGQTVDILA